MRVRADQVRVGHRLGGAVVTRVQPTLNWGLVRITLEQPSGSTGGPGPDGTFSYLPDDIIDVQSPRSDAVDEQAVAPAVPPPRTGGLEESREPAPVRRTGYRVEYQAVTGDGHVVVSGDETSTSVVAQAQELLRRQGIDARIRRIVPLERREPVAGHLRRHGWSTPL